jgi:transcriptional regulator with XRE-family HTH domain
MAHSTHHDDYQLLIAVLRTARRELRVTQVELGERLGNTQTFISKVERGERRLDVVEFVEFCEALGASPEETFRRYLGQRARGSPPGKKKASAGRSASG